MRMTEISEKVDSVRVQDSFLPILEVAIIDKCTFLPIPKNMQSRILSKYYI